MELYLFSTPLGEMGLGEKEGAITALYLPGRPVPRLISRPTPLLEEGRLVGELRPGETGLHAVQSALGRLYPGLQVRQDRESGRLFCAME